MIAMVINSDDMLPSSCFLLVGTPFTGNSQVNLHNSRLCLTSLYSYLISPTLLPPPWCPFLIQQWCFWQQMMIWPQSKRKPTNCIHKAQSATPDRISSHPPSLPLHAQVSSTSIVSTRVGSLIYRGPFIGGLLSGAFYRGPFIGGLLLTLPRTQHCTHTVATPATYYLM